MGNGERVIMALWKYVNVALWHYENDKGTGKRE